MTLPDSAVELLRKAVAAGVTPGAVALAGGSWANGAATPEVPAAFGVRRDDGPAATTDTRYDLASLTKVVATLPAILRLLSDSRLSLDDRIGRYFSNAGWFRTPSLAETTLRQLLCHTSGLPAWRPLFAELSERRTALAAILQTPLEVPGKLVYSDLGFMLLGALVERVSGQRLELFTREQVFAPLGMNDTGFGPVSGVPVAATEECGWRGRLLEGEVHDENATVWEGVSGHAGLFGTAVDLAHYCRAWLDRDARLGREEWLLEAVREQSRTEGGAGFGLGWLLAHEGSPGGSGATGFGHTGFTGTSLWLEPGMGAFAVLLTNRVHPHRSQREGIGALRSAFHEALRSGAA